MLVVVAALVALGCVEKPQQELVLSNYPKLFERDVVIVIGENASQIEMEGAQAIADNLGNLTGNVAVIKKDVEITEKEKAGYNLILIGMPDANSMLRDVYERTNATKVTNEYPGAGKGVLEILRSPWNDEKAVLLVAGSDEWGVKAGSDTITSSQKLIGKSMEIPIKLKIIQGEVKQISFVSAKMWVIQTSEGEMYVPVGNMSQEIISLGEGKKVKVKGYVTEIEITIPEAGEFHKYSQKAIEVISYDLQMEEK
jgi:hypothetical protein